MVLRHEEKIKCGTRPGGLDVPGADKRRKKLQAPSGKRAAGHVY